MKKSVLAIVAGLAIWVVVAALPSAKARRAKIRDIGYGAPSDFELNFGRYLPTFGRADDDDTTLALKAG